jgi:hypothetical protein
MVTERAQFCGPASTRIGENDEPYKKPDENWKYSVTAE